MNQGFGPHLTLDLSECNFSKLVNKELLYNFLRDYPEKIGMTRISEPFIMEYLDKFAETPGYTGFVILAESHISFHTFPDNKYIFVDLFSCRNFDYDDAAKQIIELFEAKKSDVNIVERGKDFVMKYTGH